MLDALLGGHLPIVGAQKMPLVHPKHLLKTWFPSFLNVP